MKKKKKKVHSRINSEVEKMCAQIFCPIISTLDKLGLTLSLSLLLDFFSLLFWLKFHFSGAYGGLDLTAVRFESNGSWRFQIPHRPSLPWPLLLHRYLLQSGEHSL